MAIMFSIVNNEVEQVFYPELDWSIGVLSGFAESGFSTGSTRRPNEVMLKLETLAE
jgi:hypothetical protein